MAQKKLHDGIKRACHFALYRTPGLQELVMLGARQGLVPARAWRRFHPRGVWRLHAPDGAPFRYDSAYEHDRLARHIVWTDLRDWEAGTQQVIFSLARKARVFLDVGAYSGVYTVLACLANPALRAIAFEPNPVKLPQITANVAANGLAGRVTLIGKALADRAGSAVLTIGSDDSTATLLNSGSGDRTVEVQVTTGNLVLAGLPVDLVKVDVEGLETEVLTGMSEILTACQPEVIAECLSPQALERLRRCASGFGYRNAYRIDHDGPVPVQRVSFRPANYLLAVRPVTEPLRASPRRGAAPRSPRWRPA